MSLARKLNVAILETLVAVVEHCCCIVIMYSARSSLKCGGFEVFWSEVVHAGMVTRYQILQPFVVKKRVDGDESANE